MYEVKIIGMGGHSRSIVSRFHKTNILITGYYDDNGSINEFLSNEIKFLGKFDQIDYDQDLILGIGSNSLRKYFYEKLNKKPRPLKLIDNKDVKVNEGAQIFENVYMGPNVIIGINTIINTGSIIEHDNIIGNHSHISIGCVLGGNVKIGDNCFIGANSTILDNVSIANNIVVGAGSVVTRDLLEKGTYVGSPAKILEK